MSANERTGLASVLAGLAAATLAGVAVGVGIHAGEVGTGVALVAVMSGVGLIAAAATRSMLRRRARARSELSSRLDGIDSGAMRPVADGEAESDDMHRRIGVAAQEVRQLREIADGVHGVEALFDVNGRLVWISPSVERLTGRTPDACLAAADAIELLVHESDRRYCLRMAQRVADGAAAQDFEMRLLRDDGRICWVACHWKPLGGQSLHAAGLRMSAEDIQARKETEYKLLETVTELRRAQALREHYLARSNDERQRLSALLNVIRLGILFIDHDHRVLYFNRAMLDIWAFPFDENLIGMRDLVLQSRVADLLAQPEAYFEHVQGVLREHAVSEPFEIHFKDGRVVTDVSAVVEGAEGRRGIGRVWIYEDVTEQRRIAKRLVELAERDPLTNLYNRRRFHEELDRLLADAQRRSVEVGLVAIDLDGFKPINDAFGHQAGDEVLVRLAADIGGLVRRNEMFFRLGGDEFGVLVPDAGESDVCELARRIVEGVDGLRFRFGQSEAGLTASVGIALFPRHARNAEQLIAAADQAMYQSKSGGRNRWTMSGSSGCESARMPTEESDESIRRED